MNAAKAVKNFRKVQQLFRVAAALQLTGYLWPSPVYYQNGTSYDYIIVGGGTAGCVVASKLVELEKASVLVIEAGGYPPLESMYSRYFAYMKQSPFDWNITSSQESAMRNHKGGLAEMVQGKMLGGTSSLNHMVYAHGNPLEYDKWATVTQDPSWSYKSIHPYFTKNENHLDKTTSELVEGTAARGSKGKISLRKFYFNISEKYLGALKEKGNKIVLNIDANNPVGFTHATFTCSKHARQSTAYSYLSYVKENPHLDVMINSLVVKIIFDDFKNAVGVEVRTENKQVIRIAANKEVIITAGALKTPQLLMLSGIGPKKYLQSKGIKVLSDLPVGKNLRDHPICVSVYKMGHRQPTYGYPNPYKIEFPVLHGMVPLNEYNFVPTYEIRSFILDDPETFLILCSVSFSFRNELCDKILNGVGGHQIFLVLNHLSYPKSQGKVSLGSKNMKDQPVVKLGFYNDAKDLELHSKSLVHFNEILNTTYFKRVNAEFVDPHLDECGKLKHNNTKYWRCYVKSMSVSLQSSVGTCAMGSVVDSKLFVKGVHRLRVADASIMPTLVAAPPLASVIMIAQKASDMIKEDFIRHS